MPDIELKDLLGRQGARVRAVLNILVESPYFYRTDDELLFDFLLRYHREFGRFVKDYYDWDLIYDGKCARVFKSRWYNSAISPGKRRWFRFTRRDECLAFMMLLEFFEQQMDEQNISVEDSDNLRFYFGDLLAYTHRRFQDLYPDAAERYAMETVRKLLRDIMPELEQDRLVQKLKPDAGDQPVDDQVIYEALPALYHYNATRLSQPLAVQASTGEEDAADAE
jgi:hypothetical protein